MSKNAVLHGLIQGLGHIVCVLLIFFVNLQAVIIYNGLSVVSLSFKLKS